MERRDCVLDADDREEILDALRHDGSYLDRLRFVERYHPYDVTCDHEVVLTAVQQHGAALEFADEALQGNREIVLAAVRSNPNALQFASEALRGDPAVVLTAVQTDVCGDFVFHYATEALRDDREFVLLAVQHSGWHELMPMIVLSGASEPLRADREVVLTAMQANGWALHHASEALRADREVVLTAVRQNGSALEHAAEARRADREVVLTAVQNYGDALKHASEALRTDPEVVLTAVQQNADALEFAADDLLEEPTFAAEAKRRFHLLKLTILSGRSTVVAACGNWQVASVLYKACERLGLANDGARMELWHALERVPDAHTAVEDWPGIQPEGEISEYQLVLTR